MRNLEVIENELSAAREALVSVEGMPAEVYSRIVGYYRSVRNWNRGKREEYGERRLYSISEAQTQIEEEVQFISPAAYSPSSEEEKEHIYNNGDNKLLLFVRTSCPACPPAKNAAGRLGVPVNLVNADTVDGLLEAQKWNVFSTPMAILLSSDGSELCRAKDADAIGKLPVYS